MNRVEAEAGVAMLAEIESALIRLANFEKGLFLEKYFKTGPGQYGEGDLFRGVCVPEIRRLAKTHRDIPLEDAKRLLRASYHEDRLLALIILVLKYSRADASGKSDIYSLYLDHTRFINNWDLVDCSAQHLVGAFLNERSKAPLHGLARSHSIWERRIAILATFHFIKQGKFDETLRISGILLEDREDLIHKAVGWMLREVGKRDPRAEEAFLNSHYSRMPRTMLRYAIEKFPREKRLAYLKGTMQ
ncbi:MAG: DNA alkylation repair protein [Syntrophobacteraceae bacterium]|nr:DNA alkylation repair protein [Syntrophobacteraceae bacterium]